MKKITGVQLFMGFGSAIVGSGMVYGLTSNTTSIETKIILSSVLLGVGVFTILGYLRSKK